MAAIDHSITYKKFRLKNIPHILRLRKIKEVVNKNLKNKNPSYADFGCSNGYITNIIAKEINATKVDGFDWTENVTLASELYPEYKFGKFNLNEVYFDGISYDLVTCFETLEHVGSIKNAVSNLLTRRNDSGVLIISVPVEIGVIGIIKYLLKRILYRYSLPLKTNDYNYFKSLLKGDDISSYRETADGYGSHFGFDYRLIDKYLLDYEHDIYVSSFISFTTKIYVITDKNQLIWIHLF